jgi:hypothetical protein
MNAMTTNERVVIGGNKPPLTPYEQIKREIDDLYLTAMQFLDGEPITTSEMAGEVEKLKDMISKAIKTADEARKAEAKPFDEAKAEIQERYNALIGQTKGVTGTAVLALDVCKKALTPWLVAEQARKDEEARKAREEAERLRQEAIAAHKAAAGDDLAAQVEAEAAIKTANQAERAANSAEKATITKTGLRITYHAEVEDAQTLARHVWTHDPEGIAGYCLQWANAAVRAQGLNAKHMTIPGCRIVETKEAR